MGAGQALSRAFGHIVEKLFGVIEAPDSAPTIGGQLLIAESILIGSGQDGTGFEATLELATGGIRLPA